MRIFTIVNVVLWVALFVAWTPYLMVMGLGDPVSRQVLLILVITAGLMSLLAVYRLRGRRHILG